MDNLDHIICLPKVQEPCKSHFCQEHWGYKSKILINVNATSCLYTSRRTSMGFIRENPRS